MTPDTDHAKHVARLKAAALVTLSIPLLLWIASPYAIDDLFTAGYCSLIVYAKAKDWLAPA